MGEGVESPARAGGGCQRWYKGSGQGHPGTPMILFLNAQDTLLGPTALTHLLALPARVSASAGLPGFTLSLSHCWLSPAPVLSRLLQLQPRQACSGSRKN